MAIYIPQRPPVKAGPLGPGAGPLLTEPILSTYLRKSPQQKMRQAWQLGISVPWIRAAERVVSDTCASVAWHLDDDQDDEIDDSSTDIDARRILGLLEKPQAAVAIGKKLTRRDLWALTFRHMGLCGNAFWYLDQRDGLGIPAAILYIRPDRMTPKEDAQGNLVAWALDANARSEGTRIELAEVIQFMFQAPDDGHFGTGLVESALLKAQLTIGVDQHAASVLAAGGRLAGLLAPKTGTLENTQYEQIVRDARSITEQPDAAKRLQVLRAPVDFTSTAMTMDEAKIVDMMVRTRDDLMALWGVPLSQVGVTVSTGMNSGESRKYDEAALWQNAIHPRLVTFTEAVQYQMLDPITATTVELEIEEPEFDDEAPRFSLLTQALNTALTNRERRELIGLDPFGDPALDDAVWMPMTMTQAFVAPNADAAIAARTKPIEIDPTTESRAAGETAQKASLQQTLVKLRTVAERTLTPKIKSAVSTVLAAQRHDVAAWLRTHNDHVAANPKDRAWWNAGAENRRMRTALAAPVMTMAQQVNEHITAELKPVKASPLDAAQRALTRGAARVTNINQATQDAIAVFIADGIEQGLSPAELADAIESGVTLDNGVPAFDEYRAELIARTELMDAYNGAALASYSDAGVTEVEAIDGDGDEECAARDGQTFSVEEADSIEDHPNGTLDWIPVFGGI